MSNNRYDLSNETRNLIRNNARLLYVSESKYDKDWVSTPHSHNCSEMFYVTGGNGEFRIEDEAFKVSVNDLIIINPHVEHCEMSLKELPLEYIVLGVDGLELTGTSDIYDRYCMVNFKNVREATLFYLKEMLKELESKTPSYETVCQDLMEILIILIIRQSNFSVSLAPVKKSTTRLCASVKRYIDEHYKEQLTLENIADMCHVNKYYMVHAYTKEYGISPITYCNMRCIEEAKLLLKNDDYRLSLISQILGFSSPSYFSQSFKKHVGMSPKDYRKLTRSKNFSEK